MPIVLLSIEKAREQGGVTILRKRLFIVVIGCATALSCARREPPITAPLLPLLGPELIEGQTEIGKASYYGKRFHGRKTANGERFDMYALTAAHRRLPFGTWVRVERLDNQSSVMLRINDRGPFVRGRIIDVSYGVAKILGFIREGTIKVKVTPVYFAKQEEVLKR